MRNQELAGDYVRRAAVRLRALDVLFDAASWADVVRESQEVVELGLKGLLRACGVEPPRVHDVSEVLKLERGRLPSGIAPHVEALANASRALRRDRELAYYGAEDLTPSGFYTRDDAVAARDAAAFVIGVVRPAVLGE